MEVFEGVHCVIHLMLGDFQHLNNSQIEFKESVLQTFYEVCETP